MLVEHRIRELAPSPYQIFDLICGTSTGGIIAILLGRRPSPSIRNWVSECLGGTKVRCGVTFWQENNSRLLRSKPFWGEVVEKYTGSPTTRMKIEKDAIKHRTTDVGNAPDCRSLSGALISQRA